MRFAHIVPTAHLEELDKYSNMHLILEHVAKCDDTYADFFKKSNKYKILDNGAYEKGYPTALYHLIQMADKLKADEIVIPDVFQNAKATLIHFKDFRGYIAGHPEVKKKYKFMAVPQGKTAHEYLNCLHTMATCTEVDVIGLSFIVIKDAFKEITGFSDIRRNRLFLTSILALSPLVTKGKEFHLLGMGNCQELELQKKHPFIRSADSSTCFIHGLYDIVFDKKWGLANERIEKKINFQMPPISSYNMKTIIRNMEVLNGFTRVYGG